MRQVVLLVGLFLFFANPLYSAQSNINSIYKNQEQCRITADGLANKYTFNVMGGASCKSSPCSYHNHYNAERNRCYLITECPTDCGPNVFGGLKYDGGLVTEVNTNVAIYDLSDNLMLSNIIYLPGYGEACNIEGNVIAKNCKKAWDDHLKDILEKGKPIKTLEQL